MIERKKKLKYVQISLLIIGILILFFTYFNQKIFQKETIDLAKKEEEIKKDFTNKTSTGDIFFNIEYSGLDLAGNRYVLKSKEAFSDQNSPEIIKMTSVRAFFYFKDDTVLEVSSDNGVYNNKTLDMIFNGDVKALYEESKLFAQKAEYSNSKSFLVISEQVKVQDIKGTIKADKLLFDIKEKKLNIASFNNQKINANINLKWKKVSEF